MFQFAALGLIDIAYHEPKNSIYRFRDSDYLSVYDGLMYARLNDFGRYVLGLTDDIALEDKRDSSTVVLDQKRLIATVEGPARLERMVLERFADKIGENYYKISYQSFLRDCQSARDIKNKIETFKTKITSALPQVWKEFFDEIDSKINPLEPKRNLHVYKIKPSQELVSLIARDELLRKYIPLSIIIGLNFRL